MNWAKMFSGISREKSSADNVKATRHHFGLRNRKGAKRDLRRRGINWRKGNQIAK